MARRILAIRTNSYPNSATATRRFESFARYLDESGNRVTVLALAPNESEFEGARYLDPNCGFEAIHVPPIRRTQFQRRAETVIARRLFPEWEYNPMDNFAVSRAAERLLQERRFDLLLTTYRPLGSLRLVNRLARRHGIPWVADLRDLPDQFDRNRRAWLTRRASSSVAKACQGAEHVITVSKELARMLQHQYALKSPVSVIYNGFELSQLAEFDRPQHLDEFHITYCGSGGYGRDIGLLMQALSALASRGGDLRGVKVKVFGVGDPASVRAEDWVGSEMLLFPGRVSHREALQKQVEAGVLLSLASPGGRGIITSKVFEYAMIGRPVLSIPATGDELDDFIQESGIGIASSDVLEIAEFLENLLTAWRVSGRPPVNTSKKEFVARFTRKAQAEKLVELVGALVQ